LITKYAVLNPLNGQYTKVSTKEEAYSVVVQNVFEMYKVHSHMNFITEIQIDEDNNETWLVTNNGTELPQEYLDKIQAGINK